MKKRTAYIFFVLLVITGILHTWFFNRTRASHGYMDLFIGVYFVVGFLTFFILSIVFYPKKKFVILSVSTFVLCISLNILLKQDFVKGKPILSVQLFHASDSIPEIIQNTDLSFKLDFKKNGQCVLHKRFVDYSYSYPYDYYISNDTITIDEDVVTDSDSALTTRYVIDRAKKIIIPVEKDRNKLPCLNITYDKLEQY
ncbi:MAG TPA: hypothetical protein PKY63_09725 [Bacteroidales bacterium]|nr:hypothetical protein [Bacteroidales bacterium]